MTLRWLTIWLVVISLALETDPALSLPGNVPHRVAEPTPEAPQLELVQFRTRGMGGGGFRSYRPVPRYTPPRIQRMPIPRNTIPKTVPRSVPKLPPRATPRAASPAWNAPPKAIGRSVVKPPVRRSLSQRAARQVTLTPPRKPQLRVSRPASVRSPPPPKRLRAGGASTVRDLRPDRIGAKATGLTRLGVATKGQRTFRVQQRGREKAKREKEERDKTGRRILLAHALGLSGAFRVASLGRPTNAFNRAAPPNRQVRQMMRSFKTASGAAQLALRAARKDKTCSFHGDTLVLTDRGKVPIRDILPGVHRVWSMSEYTGETGWKDVLAHYSNVYDESVHIQILDPDTGAVQTIISNRIHPFFARVPSSVHTHHLVNDNATIDSQVKGGWIEAASLNVGTLLLSSDHSWDEVIAVNINIMPLRAFNLTIERYHTYYVGAFYRQAAVLVHNECYSENFKSRNAAFRGAKRNAGIPNSQKPAETFHSFLRHTKGGSPIEKDGRDVRVRNYIFSHPTLGKLIVSEHSLGHENFKDQPASRPHFNVERYHGRYPNGEPITSSIPGVSGHYNF